MGSVLSGLAYGVTNGSITVGDLTVTGTCSNCGAGSGTFTTWSKITDFTTDSFTSNTNNWVDAAVTNTGTFTISNLNTTVVYDKDGTVVTSYRSANDDFASQPSQFLGRSVDGTYVSAYDFTPHQVRIYTNGTLLTSIPVDTTSKYFSTADVVPYMSPNGKYILVWGYNNTINLHTNRVQLWQGS